MRSSVTPSSMYRRSYHTQLIRDAVPPPTHGLPARPRLEDMTLPMLLEGVSTFILAQTGTGKTLAYVPWSSSGEGCRMGPDN